MSDREYTPLEHEARESFVTGQIRDADGGDWTEFADQARAEFDRFVEATRRDAAREALDSLLAKYDRVRDNSEHGTAHWTEWTQHAFRIAAHRERYNDPEETP